jgi:2-polyprenyl-3-methyl-5-hydroxy-6-metoxy-1,4-benzoquinol methylase
MTSTSQKYDYSYQNSNLGHHHVYLIKPLMKMINETVSPPQNQQKIRILDLGCGNGSFTNFIAQQGYEVVGIEESESGTKLASENFPDCQFIQGSIYNLPYTELEEKFDVVISLEVIEHLFYPKELVRSVKKLLKPNGRLILTTPYHGYLKNLTLAATGKMDKHFTVLWDGGHIKFWSVKTLTTLLESENYTDINFKFAGRYPYLWKTMLCSSRLIQS